MKKVSFAEFGGPDVLQLIDTEEPHAGPGQVRIAVRAAGVNPVDWRIREGQVLGAHPVSLPAGVGQDASGVVDEIGDGVEGVAVGDAVFGEGLSTYAEFAVLSAWARMPEGLTFEEAAGYPSVVETALRIIREVGVQPGQTLLVSGASGGVGSAVLQIAGARGIRVIGTAGAASQEYLRGLGALATTYGEGWVERVRLLGTVDAALDLAGSGVIRELVELTGDPQRVVSIADLDAPKSGVRFSGVAGSVPDALAEAAGLISRGKLHIPVDTSYTLAGAGAAHIDSQAGHTRGRRVIVVRAADALPAGEAAG
ncbi:NADP-dependent oxidoreductase [Streptomyces sp. NPDC058221]|uniref:NADP-dependent oxidoreductase n=1 Tax=Streptomyces sp. NPDC058221 TaxID=3346388 RepID=UPI0036E708F9